MGSPVPKDPSARSVPAQAGPEALARVVLRCRELTAFLDAIVKRLPGRKEAPFLYSQLDDGMQRLQASLRPLAETESTLAERGPSFLRRLAGKKRPRKSQPRYDLQGNAWTIPVTELVGFLSHSGKSGLLWVTSTQETFVLEFDNGSLIHATSNAPPAAFRLGEILLTLKLLEPSDLTQVIEHARAADDLLGSYLVRTGRLSHSDMQRALTHQVQELFHRLMDAENALYSFQDGAQLLRSQSLEVNITHLLLESARKKDEARFEAERDSAKDTKAPHEDESRKEDEPAAEWALSAESLMEAASLQAETDENGGSEETPGKPERAAPEGSEQPLAALPETPGEDEAEAEALENETSTGAELSES